MPTYVYECENGHTFEHRRSVMVRDEPLACEFEGVNGPWCPAPCKRIEIPSGKAPAFVTRPGVGDRSPFSRDREGK